MQKLAVAVIGSGTMGNGIAHCFAQKGNEVLLIDANPAQLENALITIEKNLIRQVKKGTITAQELQATLSNISTNVQIDETIATRDIVVEAVTEDEEVKSALFVELDRLTPSSVILASNTSSISISNIAKNCLQPERIVGMHFMNPVPIMELVEVIKGDQTSPNIVTQTEAICSALGKTPIIAKDFPGFVANRILMPMLNEAILAREQGVSGTAEIDQIMMLGMSHPMGPLELADLIGLDVCLNIMAVLHKGFKNDKYRPAKLLQELVEKGHNGRKSGSGFYTYSLEGKSKSVAPLPMDKSA